MKEGDVRNKKEICKRRTCEYCEEPATYCIAFIFPDGRSNPASKAYRRDDCSFCSDKDIFVCDKHEKDRYKIGNEWGMAWCSTFSFSERFLHMFLYWQEVKNEKETNS